MREMFNLVVAVLIAIAVGNIAVALTNHFLRTL
jgi:hypothetical protein